MSSDFVDTLPLDPCDKDKVKTLGVDSEPALYALMEAAWEQFSLFLGAGTAERLRSFLSSRVPKLLPPDSVLPRFALGAQINQVPKWRAPDTDIELRDRLFKEWSDLQTDPATRDSERSIDLRAQLEELLNK